MFEGKAEGRTRSVVHCNWPVQLEGDVASRMTKSTPRINDVMLNFNGVLTVWALRWDRQPRRTVCGIVLLP